MAKKKSKSVLGFDNFDMFLLLKFAEEDFKKTITNRLRRNKSISPIQLSRLNKIIDNCFLEINDLKSKLVVPGDEELSETVGLIFELILLAFMQDHLYYIINTYLDRIGKNQKRNKVVSNQLINKIDSEVNGIIKLFALQINLSDIKWTKDLNLKPDQIREIVSHGQKFLGKGNRKYEIPAFKKVIQKYNQLKEEDLNPKYKSIALNIARIELGLIHDREQVNFYNRFLEYIKPKK